MWVKISLEERVTLAVLKAEVKVWARIGVEPQAIQIRPMKRKCASCSSKGRLMFSTDLLRQPALFRAQGDRA